MILQSVQAALLAFPVNSFSQVLVLKRYDTLVIIRFHPGEKCAASKGSARQPSLWQAWVFTAGLVRVLLTFRRPQDLLEWSGTALAVAGMLLLGISLGSLLTGKVIPGALFRAVKVKELERRLTVLINTFLLVVDRFVVWTTLEAIVAVGVGLGSVLVGRNLR